MVRHPTESETSNTGIYVSANVKPITDQNEDNGYKNHSIIYLVTV